VVEGSVDSDHAGQLPSSDEVHKELIALRQRDGLTQNKVRQLGTALQRLPATHAEMRHRKYADSDLHVAAAGVVRCGVKDPRMRTEWTAILRGTLNLDGSSTDLEMRRQTLVGRLYLASKAYARHEADAYLELAGNLVAYSDTPCREPGPDTEWQPIQIDVKLIASTEDQLRQLLGLLTLEERKTAAVKVSESVFNLLPGGKQEWLQNPSGWPSNSIRQLGITIDKVVQLESAAFEQPGRIWTEAEALHEVLGNDLRFIGMRRNEGDSYRTLVALERRLPTELSDQDRYDQLAALRQQMKEGTEEWQSAVAECEAVISDALLHVARSMISIERNHEWREVLNLGGPPGNRSSTVRIPI
jgi:hypothetical protein